MTRAWPFGSGMKRSGRGKCSEDKEWVWQRVGMGREGQGVRGVDDGQGGGLGWGGPFDSKTYITYFFEASLSSQISPLSK